MSQNQSSARTRRQLQKRQAEQVRQRVASRRRSLHYRKTGSVEENADDPTQTMEERHDPRPQDDGVVPAPEATPTPKAEEPTTAAFNEAPILEKVEEPAESAVQTDEAEAKLEREEPFVAAPTPTPMSEPVAEEPAEQKEETVTEKTELESPEDAPPSKNTMRISLKAEDVTAALGAAPTEVPKSEEKPAAEEKTDSSMSLKAIADQKNRKPSKNTMRVSLKAPVPTQRDQSISRSVMQEDQNRERAVASHVKQISIGRGDTAAPAPPQGEVPETSAISSHDASPAPAPAPIGSGIPKETMRVSLKAGGLPKETMRIDLKSQDMAAAMQQAPAPAQEAAPTSNPFIQNTRQPGSAQSLTQSVPNLAGVAPNPNAPMAGGSELAAPPATSAASRPRPTAVGSKKKSAVKDILTILGFTLGFLALLLVVYFFLMNP